MTDGRLMKCIVCARDLLAVDRGREGCGPLDPEMCLNVTYR